MHALCTPSLVWVCLACGQQAPCQANPHDLVDSADAYDYPVAPSPPPHYPQPNELLHVVDGAVERDDYAEAWHNSSLSTSLGSERSAGSGAAAAGHVPASLSSSQQQRRHHNHHHRQENVQRHQHQCVNEESDSYLSMAATSHHHHHHRTEGSQDNSTAQYRPSPSSPHQPEGRNSYKRQENHDGNVAGGSQRSSIRGTARSVEAARQSLTALLMEEHLIGSREMRFCDHCHEVRCAEIRSAAELMPAVGAIMRESENDLHLHTEDQEDRHRHHRHYRHHAHSDDAVSPHATASFVSAVSDAAAVELARVSPSNTPASTTPFLYACDVSQQQQPDEMHRYVGDPQLLSTRASEATRGASELPHPTEARYEHHEGRDIPSAHLVVAVSLARMIVKVKNAAWSFLNSFHPLSPSLPMAYFTKEDMADDYEHGFDGSQRGGDDGIATTSDGSLRRHRWPGHQGVSQRYDGQRGDAAATVARLSSMSTASSPCEAAEELYALPRCHMAASNSPEDEDSVERGGWAAAAARRRDSNGISNLSSTTPYPHSISRQQQEKLRQLSWSSDIPEMADLQLQESGSRCSRDNAFSASSSPVYATTANSGSAAFDAVHSGCDGASRPTSLPLSPATTSTAPLRACKDKWNAISIPEALWRLVLPSFSAPFLDASSSSSTSFAAAAATRSFGSSPASTPHRGGGGGGFAGGDAVNTVDARGSSAVPYRGFRGEVHEAVQKLESMQLEVAKLRLEQILAAVTAEQARRESVSRRHDDDF